MPTLMTASGAKVPFVHLTVYDEHLPELMGRCPAVGLEATELDSGNRTSDKKVVKAFQLESDSGRETDARKSDSAVGR
jgi:hypothetical protein